MSAALTRDALSDPRARALARVAIPQTEDDLPNIALHGNARHAARTMLAEGLNLAVDAPGASNTPGSERVSAATCTSKPLARAINPALSDEALTFAQHRAADDDRRRFIPAHAGNTSTTSSWSASTTVHPRARGEHRVARRWRHRLRGSSPRTRGTRP